MISHASSSGHSFAKTLPVLPIATKIKPKVLSRASHDLSPSATLTLLSMMLTLSSYADLALLQTCQRHAPMSAPFHLEFPLPDLPLPPIAAEPSPQSRTVSRFLNPNLPSPDAQKQQLLEFPHDLEVEDLEDDIPRRKNRAKGKVSPQSFCSSPLPSTRIPFIEAAQCSDPAPV